VQSSRIRLTDGIRGMVTQSSASDTEPCQQAIEAHRPEELARPRLGSTGMQVAAMALDKQAPKPPPDVSAR